MLPKSALIKLSFISFQINKADPIVIFLNPDWTLPDMLMPLTAF